MLSTNKKRIPKKLIITASAVLLLVAGALTYVYAFNGSLFGWKASQSATSGNGVNYGPATSEQQKSGSQIKSGSANNQPDSSKSPTSPSDTPPTPTPIPGSTKKNVQVTITAANQNGSLLQVRAIISNVTNTGTCTLTLSKSGQTTITKTAAIQPLPSSSTCKGFDIATSELTPGTWQLALHFENSTLVGDASKSVSVQ